MKVLLIHPKLQKNFYGEVRLPPLGLAYVAESLRGAGFPVSILDANLSKQPMEVIKEGIEAHQPDLVGMTAPTSLMHTCLEAAQIIKARSPKTEVMLGGVHPTLFPREVVEQNGIDYVVHGEGEEAVRDLVECLAGGGDLETVQGVAFKRNGETVVTGRRPEKKDLDWLPFPAYDLLPVNEYYGPQVAYRPFMSMITSRGCPYPCTFCDAAVIFGRGFRYHSPERTVQELRYLKERFGIREVMFKDSEFTLRKDRVEELCQLMIKENLNMKWSCNSRVGRVSEPFLQVMKDAGCRLLQFGVESGDDEILKVIKKKIKVEEVRSAFAVARKVGIQTVANFMIGNPGETREQVEKTIGLVKDIKADFGNFSFAIPFPGTELYRQAVENGWLLENYDAFNLKISDCVMNATKMSTKELKKMLKRLYRTFYFRPNYILSRIFTLNPHAWRMNFQGFLKIATL